MCVFLYVFLRRTTEKWCNLHDVLIWNKQWLIYRTFVLSWDSDTFISFHTQFDSTSVRWKHYLLELLNFPLNISCLFSHEPTSYLLLCPLALFLLMCYRNHNRVDHVYYNNRRLSINASGVLCEGGGHLPLGQFPLCFPVGHWICCRELLHHSGRNEETSERKGQGHELIRDCIWWYLLW